MIQLSVVIITFNEEEKIERCIDSVMKVADEILIVDSFSTDRTKEICEAKGVRFIANTFEGHIEQKNYAKAEATHEHILSLDADEALSPMLRKSILYVKENWTEEGYEMNRLNNFCGKWIRSCGWYPDTKIRLFKKDNGIWQGTNPHDFFKLFDGKKAGFLQGDLLHYTYESLDQLKKQTKYFGEIAGRDLYARKGKPNAIRLLMNPTVKFIKFYLLKRGIADGTDGFHISYQAARGTYIKYSTARNTLT